MSRPMVRIGIAVGITLLALGALGMGPLSPIPPGDRRVGSVGLACFWSEQGLVCVERAIRLGATGLDPEMALEALLAGPTAEERARGLRSAIPEGTALEGVEVGSLPGIGEWPGEGGRAFTVRLVLPDEPLVGLDGMAVEEMVEQIAATLEPLGWRDLRVEALDPATHEFRSLADFLPPLPAPRKETLPPPLSPPLGGMKGGKPQGALSGKTVYVSAGHGWQWNGYAWRAQRPPYPNPPYVGPIIEDHNNAEAVNQYLLAYLWNAGARVIPARERDMNGTGVVVDNDDPGPGTGYVETGNWTTATPAGTGYAGTDYRRAETADGTPTATAVWTAVLPADGRYAVYVWYRQGGTHTPDAHYVVHHAGGSTEVIVGQHVHGDTWHYVGTYGFRGGEEARVVLTNQSTVAGRVVVADAVRFGGGTFDDLTGIGTTAPHPPDKPWWEVAAYYYTQWMGLDPDDWPYFNDVVARPMYARWEHAGTGEDAIYVSWHTNGYSGYQWDFSGTVSYIHSGEGEDVTPGSAGLRHAVHAELVHDIRAGWDSGWRDLGERSRNLGELRELWDDDAAVRMPGALIELAYHDHPDDTDALKEPRFNMLAARAVYQGIVKYFEQRDGVGLALLPEPPTHLAVQNVGAGQVRVSWHSSPTDATGLVGDAATGYRVYTSTDGLGWSNGVVVATTVYTLTGLSPEQLLFVRVTATNGGGESFPTETLGVRAGDETGVLLVNGFDRLSSAMLVPDYDPVEGYNLRMFLDRMNGYDYVVQHGEVISYPFDSASNEVVRDGAIDLSDYALVDWILGEESVANETLDDTERAFLTDFLRGGGALFLSGTEVGWHLDDQEGDSDFYNSCLRADYAGDDAETYEVAPAPGSILEGLAPFRFDAPGMYDADRPDQMTPIGGSVAALIYGGGLMGTAAVQYADTAGGCERLVYFGFPFETVWPDQRPAVMGRVLDFLDLCLATPANTKITTPADGSADSSVPPFGGIAGASDVAVQRVEVQVERGSDGRYWTGSDWALGSVWVPGTTWVTATGTVSWSYPLPSLSDSGYYLRARARTTDGGVDPSPDEVFFTYDTTPPANAVLIAPADGSTVSLVTDVVLTWESVGSDGGSSLAYVVELDGQPYTTTQSTYVVSHISGGPHAWGVQVFDAAGNRSEWATGTFYVRRYDLWLSLVMRNAEGGGSTCAGVLVNGGFESGEGWVINRLAAYETSRVHSGARGVRVGIPPGEPGDGAYSSVAQTVPLPAGSGATLRLWVYPIGEGDDPGDWHYVGLSDSSGNYHFLDAWQSDARAWEQREYDLGAYVGQTVTVYIGTRNDGDDDTAALYVDDVALEVCP
ncbi:MAG: fibronectin type III domain-containing protein [Anaerolineae bacterium]|nr:fibronectin type III domain-containing protein [Anaerolineae bacterium]